MFCTKFLSSNTITKIEPKCYSKTSVELCVKPSFVFLCRKFLCKTSQIHFNVSFHCAMDVSSHVKRPLNIDEEEADTEAFDKNSVIAYLLYQYVLTMFFFSCS